MPLVGVDLPEQLEKAVIRTLEGSADVRTAFGATLDVNLKPRIYDRVPTAHKLPYIQIGQIQIVDDSHCIAAWEVFVTTHVWSDKPGKYEAQRIGAAVAAALNTALSMTGYTTVVSDDDPSFRDQTYFADADGLSTHGVITHRFLIDQAS